MKPDMTQEEVLNMFKQSEALLEGHFRLTSGLHSDRYLQNGRMAASNCDVVFKSVPAKKPMLWKSL